LWLIVDLPFDVAPARKRLRNFAEALKPHRVPADTTGSLSAENEEFP